MAMTNEERAAFVRRNVLRWYAAHKRDLPWRRTMDPWKILVSEMMLQQTQVDRVRAKYAEFFRLWPTVRSFARTPFAEVVRFWQGLGYNRRAMYLHRAAASVVGDHAGNVPLDVGALESLPGVGRYTARAVAAFSGNTDVVLWDTNIRRIFARAFHGGEFADAPSEAALQRALEAALPRGRARDWYNALMDLGSAVCTSRTPSCGVCPLAAHCKAASSFLRGRTPRTTLVRAQAAFKGSLREARGAALRAVSAEGGSTTLTRLVSALGRQDAGLAIEGLVRDGMLVRRGRRIAIP